MPPNLGGALKGKGADTSPPRACDLAQWLKLVAYPPRFKKQWCILPEHPDEQVPPVTSDNQCALSEPTGSECMGHCFTTHMVTYARN